MEYYDVAACQSLRGMPLVTRTAIVYAGSVKGAIRKFQKHYNDYGQDEYRARVVSLSAMEFSPVVPEGMVRRHFYRKGGERRCHMDYEFIK